MTDESTQNLSLSIPQSELETKLIEENDADNLKDIIDLFNLNIKKKDVLRINKLSDIQDKISDQIATRIDKKADEFSNADLLNYLKVVQDIIDRSDTTSETLKIPNIQINQQNNLNLGISEHPRLTKESRDKVLNAVQSILSKYDTVATFSADEVKVEDEE